MGIDFKLQRKVRKERNQRFRKHKKKKKFSPNRETKKQCKNSKGKIKKNMNSNKENMEEIGTIGDKWTVCLSTSMKARKRPASDKYRKEKKENKKFKGRSSFYPEKSLVFGFSS